MKKLIVIDSSSDVLEKDYISDKFDLKVAPLSILINDLEFVDDSNINISNLLDEMRKKHSKGKSSCPSSQIYYDLFKDYDEIYCITITKKLSGSYNSACVAMNEHIGNKKIVVIDSKAVCGVEELLLQDLIYCLENDYNQEDAIKYINSKTYNLLFVLHSLDNLVKNGRLSKFKSILAMFTFTKPIFIANDGDIKLHKKVHTFNKALDTIVNELNIIDQNLSKDSKIIISHCNNIEAANRVYNRIKEKYPFVKNVLIKQMRGLCSFYANEKGIIVSFRS